MKHFICLILAVYASFHLFAFNDYMHRSAVNAEVVDKTIREGSKHTIVREIIYQSQDGYTFKLPASEPTWQAALPGEKTRLYVRPFDYKQTTMQNFRYFSLPIIVAAATVVYLLWFLFFGWPAPKENNIGTPAT